MSAPFKRHYATARSGNAGASGMRMALDCARNVYEAVDRRMPEAAALANWLRQSAAAFGLPDTAIPDDDAPRRSRRRCVPMSDWRKIGSALTSAEGPFRPTQMHPPSAGSRRSPGPLRSIAWKRACSRSRYTINFAYPVRCQSRSRVRPVAAVEFFIRGG
jgi:hypothetical protein